MTKIKVLLVDDSGFMRLVVSDMINSSSDLMVIDTAENGLEAVQKTKSLSPDVVLLDMTMKDYDGLYAVRNIMKDTPTPIVILSSLGNTQPDLVFEALDCGAYDFVNKPTGVLGSKIRDLEQHLFGKLRNAAKVDIVNLKQKSSKSNNLQHTFDTSLYDILAIGSSTGGTGALEHILTHMPENLPIPVVIAQHMPQEFIHSFAERLNGILPFNVCVAREGDSLQPNVVYLMPCDVNMGVTKKRNRVVFQVYGNDYKEYNHPSVDCLMQSVAKAYSAKSIGVLLTGMGSDGALGMKDIFDQKGYTIAQDQASSVVFGMPKAAIETGGVKSILSLKQMPSFLVSMMS